MKLSRRKFLAGAAGGILGAAAVGASPPAPLLQPVGSLPRDITRTWLGPDYWANRLQDWRLHQGLLECLADGPGNELRTAAVLTREIAAGEVSAHLGVRLQPLPYPARSGFGGFLIGAGSGKLDYRAAALVQKASGAGGGLLCIYQPDGQVRFREHTDEERPLAFAELPSEEVGAGVIFGEVLLRLDIRPAGQGRFELRFSAGDIAARRLVVPESEILGGIALVSHGGRWGFRDLETGGGKIAAHPERARPVLGTLYSLHGRVLKLTAQFMPLGESELRAARFLYRQAGESWQDGPAATLGPDFTALFRLQNWDSSRDWEYRIEPGSYAGIIRKDPVGSGRLTIGLFSCVKATARSLEGGPAGPELPGAELLGRYTGKNIYFPHAELVKNAGRHQPDLLVFAGDQLYEGNPTRRDNSASPTLDYLYKWFLWVWSFREMTRSTPAILLVDDHDVYHGNVWGNGGRAAPERDPNRGGYRCAADFVNLVQQTQCGHNPDAYDPAPVAQGIGVYYGAFRYGGVSFAVLEDRKFKTAPIQGTDLDVHEAELLGPRQEKFLESWAGDGAFPKVCLTQTLLACLQTSPSGRPLLDFDSNGYPKPGRDRAIELLRRARALVLSGDQHLASLVRHGLESFTDGVVQFSGPAGGSGWQRWFEPARPLPHAAATPHTGDFVDAFGNKVRVLAVANPKVSFQEYREHRTGRSQDLGDRRLKSEGYGIIRVEHKAREFVIECWPWDVDPAGPGARQFAGWPYRLPFP